MFKQNIAAILLALFVNSRVLLQKSTYVAQSAKIYKFTLPSNNSIVFVIKTNGYDEDTKTTNENYSHQYRFLWSFEPVSPKPKKDDSSVWDIADTIKMGLIQALYFYGFVYDFPKEWSEKDKNNIKAMYENTMVSQKTIDFLLNYQQNGLENIYFHIFVNKRLEFQDKTEILIHLFELTLQKSKILEELKKNSFQTNYDQYKFEQIKIRISSNYFPRIPTGKTLNDIYINLDIYNEDRRLATMDSPILKDCSENDKNAEICMNLFNLKKLILMALELSFEVVHSKALFSQMATYSKSCRTFAEIGVTG